MGRHENSGTTLLSGALPSEPVDLPVVVHLVVLQHRQLHLPVLVLDLLGGGVVLLLPLFCTTPQPQHQVKGAFLLNVVVGESATVLQLLSGKDQPLLVRGDPLLVLNPRKDETLQSSKRCQARGGARRQVYATAYLDLCLHILDSVAGFHLKGDCLPREGFDKDLHDGALLRLSERLAHALRGA